MMKGLRKAWLAKCSLGLIVSCLMSGCIPENIELPINKNGNGGLMGEIPDSRAVDLGLSVKWASCNVGAESPEGYGGRYAWGETEEKTEYTWDTYKYIKNCTDISGTEYDVAHVLWGDEWRMPTLMEFEELVDKCTWEWCEVSGVEGYKITGANGNSIFLPDSPYSYGYWVASLRGSDVCYYHGTGFGGGQEKSYRAYDPFSVRPVYGEYKPQDVTVTTGDALYIKSNSAWLKGGKSTHQSFECGIIYGTSSSLSSTDGIMESYGLSYSRDFSITLTGLSANTTYYYRAFALVDGEYKYGEVRSFTTTQNISVTTGNATSITYSGAALAGSVSGSEYSLTCGIIYGTSSSLSSSSGTKKSTTSSGSYSISVTGLSANRTYYYRAYAIVDGEYVYGEVRSFTTESSSTVISGDAIDLGLSVKWASCNVGADSPEEYGDYFAWGETTAKSSYSSSTSITYGLSISELESRGIINADGNLTAANDAATANWGDNWRMPTLDEMKELINECEWECTSVNGVNGYKVKSRTNGNSIFLPAAGYRYDTLLNRVGSYGGYWSATPDGDSRIAYVLGIYSDSYDWGYNFRDDGLTVRPVTEY